VRRQREIKLSIQNGGSHNTLETKRHMKVFFTYDYAFDITAVLSMSTFNSTFTRTYINTLSLSSSGL
jgi:hypothetical protein